MSNSIDDKRKLLAEYEALLAEKERRAAKRLPPDPIAFAKSVGKTPDPWQEKVLGWSGQRLILNCSRQAGKSTTTAVLALYRAISIPKALILLISPSQRQSGELFMKVKEAIREMKLPPRLVVDNQLSLALENGSRIISLPANEGTIRGFSAVTLLIEDEAGDVPDDINIAIRPMLAVSGGQLILMGTPKGRRGHFFEAWERGGDLWDRIQVKAQDIPRYSPGFLDAERADMNRRGLGDLFRQEYEGEFVNAAAGRVYGGFDEKINIIDALPESSTPWNYVLGLDFGIVDENGLTVLAWRHNDPVVYIVRSYRFNGTPTQMSAEVIALSNVFSFSNMVGDEGGMGKAFAAEMRTRFAIPVMPADKANKVGAIAIMNGEMRVGKIKVVKAGCQELIDEWLELPWADGGKKEADGFNNHASDSSLYGYRACPNFAERVPDVGPNAGTPEWHSQREREMLDRDLANETKTRNADNMFGRDATDYASNDYQEFFD